MQRLRVSFGVLFLLYVLCLDTQAQALKPLTVSASDQIHPKYPHQIELVELENFLGHTIDYKENPLFASRVATAQLPGVTERLPEEPLVLIPYEAVGGYGGTLRGTALSYEASTSEIMSWRQANLVRFSSDTSTIVPNVAKSWKWNPDYSRITFFLRKGHRWSDGAPFTTDDVVFFFEDIILNKEIHPETPPPWRNFDVKVSKIDATTVTLIFEKPFPSLLFYLGGNGSYHDPFAPKHFLSRFHIRYNPHADREARTRGFENWVAQFRVYWNKWKDTVLSTPHGLEVPTLESHVLESAPTPQNRIFVANPYYFKIDTAGNQLPYIDRHHERFLEKKDWIEEIIAGRIDQKSQNMPLNQYPLLNANQDKGNYILQLPINGSGPAILFNKTHKDTVKKKIYASPKFNYAASLAINRRQINDALFLGLCKPQQAVPQNVPFVTDEDKQFKSRYDPEMAGKLLDEIGLKMGPDGFRLRPDGKPLVIRWDYTMQYVWTHEMPRLIAGYWNAVGLRVELKEVPTKLARARQIANENDISNEWWAPFETTLFASPHLFMPPYGMAYPVSGVAWWQWKQSSGKLGEKPPPWVENLWEIGAEFAAVAPGSDWYNALGKKIIHINQEYLSVIGILAEVPLLTVVSRRLGNVPKMNINSYFYGYAYPYRADQWYFK